MDVMLLAINITRKTTIKQKTLFFDTEIKECNRTNKSRSIHSHSSLFRYNQRPYSPDICNAFIQLSQTNSKWFLPFVVLSLPSGTGWCKFLFSWSHLTWVAGPCPAAIIQLYNNSLLLLRYHQTLYIEEIIIKTKNISFTPEIENPFSIFYWNCEKIEIGCIERKMRKLLALFMIGLYLPQCV